MQVPLLVMRRVVIAKPVLNPDYFLILLLKAQKGRTNILENTSIGWALLLSPQFRSVFKNVEKTYPKENWPVRKLKFLLLSIIQLMLLAAIPFILFRSISNKAPAWNTIAITKGHTGIVILPDSSYVNLNAGSLLKISTDYNKDRTLLLDGEGYFKFKPGSSEKITLKTNLADILGGEGDLNISTYGDVLFVACLDGSVSVKIKKGHQVTLNAGSALKYDLDNKSWTTVNINQDTVTSWIQGVYYIDKEKLESLCKRIERVYDVRIVFDQQACKNYSFSGMFRKGDPINVILENLSHTGGVRYFYDESGVIHWR